MEPLIQIEGVSKCFDGQEKPAIDKLTTNFTAGRINGLVGPD